MKKADIVTLLVVAAVIGGFAFIPGAWTWFNETTRAHGLLMSFFKFAILGTFGEMLALRIREGVYHKKGFGILPKMLVWGVLGVVIASAMTIFKTGTLALLDGGFHLDGKLRVVADVNADGAALLRNLRYGTHFKRRLGLLLEGHASRQTFALERDAARDFVRRRRGRCRDGHRSDTFSRRRRDLESGTAHAGGPGIVGGDLDGLRASILSERQV